MDKSLSTKILMVILSVFLLITVVSQIIVIPQNSCRTEVARLYNMTDTIKFDGVFLRDEHIINGTAGGVIEYEHDDGARVAKNSVIANVYATSADIDICRRIDNLTVRIETLENAQELAGTDGSQVEAFNNLITEKHSELVQAIEDGDYDDVAQLKYQLLNLQSKRDIAKGKNPGYENVISELQKQIEKLRSRLSSQPQPLFASETGYFVSNVDGYENRLGYEYAEQIAPKEIKELIEKPRLEGSASGTIGKMVESYTWRIAAVISEQEASMITVGDEVRLYYAADASTLKVRVDSVENYGSEGSVVVFSGDEMKPSVVSSRIGRFELVISGYNGIRIPSEAVRFNDKGEKGVYILYGNIGYFRKIEELYSGEDFVIAEHTIGADGYLELYDNIIVWGKFEKYVSNEESSEGGSGAE